VLKIIKDTLASSKSPLLLALMCLTIYATLFYMVPIEHHANLKLVFVGWLAAGTLAVVHAFYRGITGTPLFVLPSREPEYPSPAALAELHKRVAYTRATTGFKPRDLKPGHVLMGIYGHPLWDHRLCADNNLALYLVVRTTPAGVIIATTNGFSPGNATGTDYPWTVPWECIACNLTVLHELDADNVFGHMCGDDKGLEDMYAAYTKHLEKRKYLLGESSQVYAVFNPETPDDTDIEYKEYKKSVIDPRD